MPTTEEDADEWADRVNAAQQKHPKKQLPNNHPLLRKGIPARQLIEEDKAREVEKKNDD